MLRKAQAEIALILGLLAIAAVVGVYSYSSFIAPSMQPSGLAGDQKGIETYIRSAITDASMSTLGKIYDQGGYLDISDAERKLDWANFEIAYWQICDETYVRTSGDVEPDVEEGIEEYLKDRLPEKTSIAGRQVEFDFSPGAFSVDARILERKVTLSVKLPVTIDGVRNTNPFNMEIDSDLGRILMMAGDFTRTQEKYRVLDQNFMDHLYTSNPDYECWIPTMGISSSKIKKTYAYMRTCTEEFIAHVLARTHLWYKPFVRDDGSIPEPVLENSYIFEVMHEGESWGQYADLDVSLYSGLDGRFLSTTNPEFLLKADRSLNPLRIKGYGIPLISLFIPYDIKYDISYPVVVTVMDENLRRSFKFANFVNIKENVASDEGCDLDAVIIDPQTEKCDKGAQNPVKITVTDQAGMPLKSVDGSFDGCPFTIFDDKGVIETSFHTPQTSKAKLMLDYGNSEYVGCYSVGELEEETIQMPLLKNFDVKYFIIDIADGQFVSPIKPGDTKNVSVVLSRDIDTACMEEGDIFDIMFDNYYEMTDDGPKAVPKSTGKADIYATETYTAEITTISESSAMVTSTVQIMKDDSTIYIYAPNMLSGSTIGSAYEQAGIQPIMAAGG